MCKKVSLECMKYNRGAVTQAHPARNRFYKLIKIDHSMNQLNMR